MAQKDYARRDYYWKGTGPLGGDDLFAEIDVLVDANGLG